MNQKQPCPNEADAQALEEGLRLLARMIARAHLAGWRPRDTPDRRRRNRKRRKTRVGAHETQGRPRDPPPQGPAPPGTPGRQNDAIKTE